MRRWNILTRLTRLTMLPVVLSLLLVAAGCGSDGSAGDPPATTTEPGTATTVFPTSPPETSSPETSSPTTTPDTAPATTAPATSAPPTTSPPAVANPASIDNPERPWVKAARDDLIARSGINIEAANCVFDRFEQEGFDVRLLVWTDDATPVEISLVIGLCGSSLTGGFDLPDEARSTADDYGSDPALDRLWDWCVAGDGASCDQLWWESPSESAYEAFADSCGGRGKSTLNCVDVTAASSYGDSPLLDLWYDSCADGYGVSCDELHDLDGARGDYLEFGRTCGGRIPTAEDPDCTGELTAFIT